MKLKTIICLLACMYTGSALAEGVALRSSSGMGGARGQQNGNAVTRTNSNSTATSVSNSSGGTGVGSQGQSLTVDSHAVYEGQSRNPVATAVAPALMSSNDTCMGSTSIGGAAVSFGFSAGTTWTDDNCVMLKNSREMWNMGFKGAALARLCMDNLNKEAFEATGIMCPQRRGAATESADATAASGGGQSESLYGN